MEYTVLLCGVAWCCVVLRGVAWCCVVLRGVACCCVLLRGTCPARPACDAVMRCVVIVVVGIRCEVFDVLLEVRVRRRGDTCYITKDQ